MWNGFQQGWPGAPGVRIGDCGCGPFPSPCPSFPFPPCGNNGCPIMLDTNCSIYHLLQSSASRLVNLNLPNGSTLQLILETIDLQLGQINVNAWSLPFLRAVPYTITTLTQFGQSVDTEFSVVQAQLNILNAQALTPITANDSASIHFVTSGTLNHTITASVKISATVPNTVSIVGDGLLGTPQTLSVDYVNRRLSITDGNTVDFSSLVCAPGGWLGNVTADPAGAADGEYWYRTDLAVNSGLKIKLNGVVKTITIS